MFQKIKDMINDSKKSTIKTTKLPTPVTSSKDKKTNILPITMLPGNEPDTKQSPKTSIKSTCPIEQHNCLAYTLTNRLISVVEEFEKNMERIGNHPTLNEATKLDIQSYINKNIITALWALSPAFDLMKDYPRIKTFKTVTTKALNNGQPGVLEEKKFI